MMTLSEVQAFLESHGIRYEEWGRTNCKSVLHLHDEITSGEATLELVNGEPTRVICVASALIYTFSHTAGMIGRRWQVLREGHHRNPDGSVVDREGLPHSVSEKLFFVCRETHESAINRALRDELHLTDPGLYTLSHSAIVRDQPCIAPPSYRGLTTLVREQSIWKCVLAESLYNPDGYTIVMRDGKSLHFHWEILPVPPYGVIYHERLRRRTGSD